MAWVEALAVRRIASVDIYRCAQPEAVLDKSCIFFMGIRWIKIYGMQLSLLTEIHLKWWMEMRNQSNLMINQIEPGLEVKSHIPAPALQLLPMFKFFIAMRAKECYLER